MTTEERWAILDRAITTLVEHDLDVSQLLDRVLERGLGLCGAAHALHLAEGFGQR